MTALIDLTGKRFGRWVVVARAENRGEQPCWLCRCDCGEVQSVHGVDLRGGRSKSCRSCAHIKHGHARRGKETRVYRCWLNIKKRCLNPRDPRYLDYGGRDEPNPITMYPEYETNFLAFYRHVGDAPANRSINRINNDGGYWPGNLNWATPREQRLNQRKPKRKARRAKLEAIQAFAASLARAATASGGARAAP